MASYEDRFYRENPDFGERIRRNVQLSVWLAGALFAWAFQGRRLRKAYRRAREDNDAIVLEEHVDLDAE